MNLKNENSLRELWYMKHTYNHIYCHLVAKLCLTLCDPVDYSLLGSSVQEISQARILEWVDVSIYRGSSPSRENLCY